MKTNNLSKF